MSTYNTYNNKGVRNPNFSFLIFHLLTPYLAPGRTAMNGYLQNGKLPSGMTEFSVQAFDYVTGRALSDVAKIKKIKYEKLP